MHNTNCTETEKVLQATQWQETRDIIPNPELISFDSDNRVILINLDRCQDVNTTVFAKVGTESLM